MSRLQRCTRGWHPPSASDAFWERWERLWTWEAPHNTTQCDGVRQMAIGDYCTQMAPDGSGHEACGAACLASVALSNGWQSDPWELTKEIAIKYGIVDRGATSQQLLDAA